MYAHHDQRKALSLPCCFSQSDKLHHLNSYSLLAEVAARTGAEIVAPDAIYDVKADIYAPCALGATLHEARDIAYAAIGAIDFPGGFYRSDIGWRALERDSGGT